MQVDKEQSFDQFSHDLTLALEATTSCGGNSRWGLRRRTRSTGNLPCPPQPTEDSSSTDANDGTNDNNNNDPFAVATNSILSDSDDRQSYAFKLRQKPIGGNFESDSLNENFSPSRPHLRRKRKFKRMAVEYETTPSTPQGSSSHPIFPLSINLKKRVIKPSQEFRSNLFFGKRKRPHRERFSEYESFRHSNSVPRQRNGFLHYQKDCSYIEYKSRNRASSMTMSRGAALEKIMPLNKSIVSKIEKISKENQNKLNFYFSPTFPLQTMTTTTTQQQQQQHEPILNFKFGKICANNLQQNQLMSGVDGPTSTAQMNFHENYKKFTTIAPTTTTTTSTANMYESALMKTNGLINNYKIESKRKIKNSLANQNSTHLKHHKHSRRFQLQFDDQNFMDCENMNDNFLSSSSLSSSESETEDTNGSDHEGDDELTDWPGHEAMVNFSRNDLRNVKRCSKLKKIKQDEVLQDDETLMSAEEVQFPLKSPSTLMLQSNSSSNPIDINNLVDTTSQFAQDGSSTSGINADYGSFNFPRVIESEMSGETSNSLLSSCIANEIREIRAGCRRIRDERPGFSIIASFNDELMRFLQDENQKQLKITEVQEYDKVMELARLYSLNIQSENGYFILNKTSNTMQAVKVSKEQNKNIYNHYKRRCVGDDTE